MTCKSRCITILSNYPKALAAKKILKKISVSEHQVVILGKKLVNNSSITCSINDYFNQIGVPIDIIQSYLRLLENGSFLLVISGIYQEIELTYQL